MGHIRIQSLMGAGVVVLLTARCVFGQAPDTTIQGVGIFEEGHETPPHTLLAVVYEHRWHPSRSRLPGWEILYDSLIQKVKALGGSMVVQLKSGTEDPWIEKGYGRWIIGIAALPEGDASDSLVNCDNCIVDWQGVDVTRAGASDADSLRLFKRQAFAISRLRLGEKGYYLRDCRQTAPAAVPYADLPESVRVDNLAMKATVVRGGVTGDRVSSTNVSLAARLIWKASDEDAWSRARAMTITSPGFDYVSGPDGVAIRNTFADLFESMEYRGPTPDSDGDGVPDSRDRELHSQRGAEVDRYGVSRDDDGDGVPNGIDRQPNTPRDITMVDEWGVALDSDHDDVPDDYDQCPDTPPEYAVDKTGCPCEILADDLVVVLLNKGVLRERFHFALDSAELTAEARARLDSIGVSLSGLPDLRFAVEGHCDDLGSAAYNDRLSERRARAAVTYLVNKFPGLSLEQFTVVGYGNRRPIAEGRDEASRALNRRVEFRVVNPEDARRKVKIRRFRLRNEKSRECGEFH